MKLSKIKIKIFIIIIIFLNKYDYIESIEYNISKKKIGIIGLSHSQNIGNNLLKYAIYIKLTELGYLPYLVGKVYPKNDISFLKNNTKIRLINDFSEIKKNEFDILMVNSDQTWNALFPRPIIYDIAFLKFAKNWKVKKFIYGASLVHEDWKFTKIDEKIAKNLLDKFTGISVREKSSVQLIQHHLLLKAQFVLDPTFIINKNYYLNLIKNYKSNIMEKINNTIFIFAYILKDSNRIKNYLNLVSNSLKLKIFYITIYHMNQVLEFLYGIVNCKAVITDSFHGTVFSIIFKKPFISFKYEKNDNRFNDLAEIFELKNRIIYINSTIPPVSLLSQPLNINETKLMLLKNESINYLKKNLQ